MDTAIYVRAILSLAFVLGLLLMLSWALKRFNLVAGGVPLGARGKPKRMRIVEILPLDARRRLVLVRRDDMEHLVLLGGTQELVVESRAAPLAEPALEVQS